MTEKPYCYTGVKMTEKPLYDDPEIEAYRMAPSGEDPHASTWKDKPHRLVHDLCRLLNESRKTKYLIGLVFIVSLMACEPPRNGECEVIEGDAGITVTCGDDEVFVQHGEDGEDGQPAEQVLQNFVDLLAEKKPSVVSIYAYDDAGDIVGHCSGMKNDDGAVVTAAHCLPFTNGFVAIYGEEELLNIPNSSTLYYWHGSVGRDIALVVPTWNSVGASLPGFAEEPAPVQNGNLVGHISMPATLVSNFQVTMGFVTDEHYSNGSVFWSDAFFADYAASGGSSGGPVFDQDGRWIGIHVGSSSEPSLELSLALPFEGVE